MKCQICKRTLTKPESIAAGIGPECAAKYATGVAAAGSSASRIQALTGLNDASVNRWLRVARLAIGAGRAGDVRRFLEAAEREAASPLAIAA